jgi:DNA-binding response OmpR family regulator
MTESEKKKILIIEDAKGTAAGYKTILAKGDYDVTIYSSGKPGPFINKGKKFDLAIVDIVLPPEDLEKYKLQDCQETGLRLMETMIANNTCPRFYVITVRNTLRSRVEKLCEEKKVVLNFEAKIDYEPEKLLDKVATLLATEIPE